MEKWNSELIFVASFVGSDRSDTLIHVRIFPATLTQAIAKKIHVPESNKIESTKDYDCTNHLYPIT